MQCIGDFVAYFSNGRFGIVALAFLGWEFFDFLEVRSFPFLMMKEYLFRMGVVSLGELYWILLCLLP